MYDHDRKRRDQDRTRTHALDAGGRRQGNVIAPYSISLTSFMRAPDYPIPSGFTNYKLSPQDAEQAAKRRAERARSGGRRGPEVVVVLLPAKLVPGAVTVTQFMSRPDIPLPASFESAEDRAAYGRQRVSEPERPEDRAIRELLDKELASWAEEQAAELAELEARGVTVRAPAGEASPGHAGTAAATAHPDATGVNPGSSRAEKPRAEELTHATTGAQGKGGRDGGMGGEGPGVREDGGVKEHAPAPTTAAPAPVKTAGPAPRGHAGPSAPAQLLSDDRAIQLLLEGVDGSQSAPHERVDSGFGDVVAAARTGRTSPADASEVPPHAPSAPVRLPSSLQGRMERAYDRRFAEVELHPDSAEVSMGQQPSRAVGTFTSSTVSTRRARMASVSSPTSSRTSPSRTAPGHASEVGPSSSAKRRARPRSRCRARRRGSRSARRHRRRTRSARTTTTSSTTSSPRRQPARARTTTTRRTQRPRITPRQTACTRPPASRPATAPARRCRGAKRSPR